VDTGCGEGRLARDLKGLGHRIVGIDSSPSLVAAARAFEASMDVRLADAAALPLDDASGDLAVAFMSFQDMNDLPAAVHQVARVLDLVAGPASPSFIRSIPQDALIMQGLTRTS